MYRTLIFLIDYLPERHDPHLTYIYNKYKRCVKHFSGFTFIRHTRGQKQEDQLVNLEISRYIQRPNEICSCDIMNQI